MILSVYVPNGQVEDVPAKAQEAFNFLYGVGLAVGVIAATFALVIIAISLISSIGGRQMSDRTTSAMPYVFGGVVLLAMVGFLVGGIARALT